MKFSMKKLIGLLVVFLVMAFALSAANLDELRWVIPKNREALSKLIDENKKIKKLCSLWLGLYINLSRYTRKLFNIKIPDT